MIFKNFSLIYANIHSKLTVPKRKNLNNMKNLDLDGFSFEGALTCLVGI